MIENKEIVWLPSSTNQKIFYPHHNGERLPLDEANIVVHEDGTATLHLDGILMSETYHRESLEDAISFAKSKQKN